MFSFKRNIQNELDFEGFEVGQNFKFSGGEERTVSTKVTKSFFLLSQSSESPFVHEEMKDDILAFSKPIEEDVIPQIGDFLPQDSVPVEELSNPEEVKDDTIKAKNIPKPSLYYGRSSNSRDKPYQAKNAARRDVVYKCLIKAVRTTLIQKFESYTDSSKFSNSTKGCKVFSQKVREFIEQTPSFSSVLASEFSNQGEEIFSTMAVFLENGYFCVGKTPEYKKLAYSLRTCTKSSSFTILNYKKLFSFPSVSVFFHFLAKSGFFAGLFQERENMKKCEGRYQEAVESIINFQRNRQLMK